MSVLINEILVFKPNSNKKELTISSPMQKSALNALEERMGADLGKKAARAFRLMKTDGFDTLQFKQGNRRVRVRQTAL